LFQTSSASTTSKKVPKLTAVNAKTLFRTFHGLAPASWQVLFERQLESL